MTITSQYVSVNLGAAANDGTGDELRTAFYKVNQNFGNYETVGFPTANIVASGTVQAAYFSGNGAGIANLTLPPLYSNVNAAAYLSSYDGTLGNVVSTSDIGWSTGLGVSVVQGTNKANTVVADGPCGNVVMDSAALSNGANVGFRLQNGFIGPSSILILNIANGATQGAYQVQVEAVETGNANIRLYNVYGASLSESVVLNFAVLTTVTS